MPLLEETTLPNNQNPSANPSSNTNSKPNSLISTISSLLPLAPLLFEQFTGQKVPALGGTMAEMKLAITQIQTNLQTVVNNQQQIYQQIEQLKTQIKELKKQNMPGEFPTDDLTKTHQEQLRKINLLFDENAQNYPEIDFNGLYTLLETIAQEQKKKKK